MKNILVPTDFSANAETALKYALGIAEPYKANVLLLNTYWVNQSALVFKDIGRIMKEEADGNMNRLLQRFDNVATGEGSLTGHVLMGDPAQITPKVADQKKCDLIVMGTKGATDAVEVFMGSVTGAVLRHSHKPVLAIPSGVQYKPLKHIVLSLDHQDLPPKEVFEALRAIALEYSAHVSIFHLRTNDNAGIDEDIYTYLDGVALSYHEVINNKGDVYKSINEFVDRQQADLLCMVRRKKGFFESLFKGSATLKQAYNSPVPLLVLMEQE